MLVCLKIYWSNQIKINYSLNKLSLEYNSELKIIEKNILEL